MRLHKSISHFLCWFALLYGVLLVPWPGLKQSYGDYFQSLIRLVFTEHSGRILRVESTTQAPSPIDTRITLANREQLDGLGKGPAKMLDLDSRGIGFIPTALVAALTLATPLPWRRSLTALFLGLLLVHGFILFSVGVYLWDESFDLGLVTLNPFWKAMVDGLEETFVTQIGASFVVPVLMWLLVTFRRQDFEAVTGRITQKVKPPRGI